MFWGTKKKEDDREKQLKHLKAAFPSMRRPNNDDTLYDLRFTVDNQYNSIRISIPEDFPQSRPGSRILIDYEFIVSHIRSCSNNSHASNWSSHSSLVGWSENGRRLSKGIDKFMHIVFTICVTHSTFS